MAEEVTHILVRLRVSRLQDQRSRNALVVELHLPPRQGQQLVAPTPSGEGCDDQGPKTRVRVFEETFLFNRYRGLSRAPWLQVPRPWAFGLVRQLDDRDSVALEGCLSGIAFSDSPGEQMARPREQAIDTGLSAFRERPVLQQRPPSVTADAYLLPIACW